MKPYRGTFLACVVLLAALPLSSCGDTGKWEKTTSITLSAPAVLGINEVTFTVVSPPPVEGFACETLLEYRAQGTGVNINWATVPGTETTRVFVVRPKGEGVLSVVARGKCADAKEDWKYSNQVDITITKIPLPSVASVTLEANPTTVVKNNPVTFALGATKSDDCTLALMYQYSGAGFGVTTVNPASIGQFVLTPHAVGVLTVTATGWCTQNPTAKVLATVPVTVTDVVLPTVSSVTLTTTTATPFNHPGTIDYNLSAIKGTGCTLVLKRQHSGTALAAQTFTPTTAGDYSVNTTGAGTATITASGWCAENPSAIVSATKLDFTVN